MLSQSIQSLASIMPTTIKRLIENQEIDKYTFHKCKFHFLIFVIYLIFNIMYNYNLATIDSSVDHNDHDEMISLNNKNESQIVENTNDHSLELTQNRTLDRSLRKFKYYFLLLLILSISGWVSLITLIISRTHLIYQLKQTSEKYQKQISMTNQSYHQQLQQFIDEQHQLNKAIQQLTNLISTCKRN